MKKVISLILAMMLLISMLTVSFSALSVSDLDDENVPYIKTTLQGIAEYEEEEGMEPGSLGTQKVYFQMPNGKTGPVADEDVNLHHPEELDPETGEVIQEAYDEIVIHAGEKAPSWYNENNVVDGKKYAGVYWWGGPAATDGAWVGYRMELVDEEQGIFCAYIPYDPDDAAASVTVAIFNNGVDGGTDSSKPIYYQAAQTVDTNVEGAWPGDYDSLPEGSPDEFSFDNCIYIIDPNQVSINAFSQKQTCGANWYVYYGNGCYGQYFEGCDEYTGDVDQDCCNPDHFKNGVHVGYQGDEPEPTDAPEPTDPPAHVHTPGEPVQENVVPATYKAGGSYDSVVYCTECGEEISRETVNTDPIALESTKLYFDTNGTEWTMGTKNKVAFHIFGGDLTNGLQWGAKKAIGKATAAQDGLFEIDPASLGLTLNPGVQYKIIFVRTDGANWTDQTYDLLFTTDCLGHVAFCDGTEYENPVDSSKKTLAAFWYGMDASVVGPVKQISSIGNVVGTCLAEGTTDIGLFNDFLTVVDDTTGKTKYDNAYQFVVDANIKTEQQMIDDIGTDLGLTKQQVYDAFAAAEIETAWDYTVSTLPGEVTPPTHEHTPGEPTEENVVPATCQHAGSYDKVVYCTSCGEELSREEIVIGKLLHTEGEPVQENFVPATCQHAGGYDTVVYCTVCGDEISREHTDIGKLLHTEGEPVKENDVPATCTQDGGYDMVTYCTVCGDEISREHTVVAAHHDLKFVPSRKATETTDGWKSHFECKVCGKYFADANAERELQWSEIVIPKTGAIGTLGDVDGDKQVTIIDVTIIQRALAGINVPYENVAKLGDIDQNGTLEVTDATLLQRWLLGLNQDLEIGKSITA